MNKKSIAAVRKEFKSDSFKLRPKEILTVYVKKESDEVFHQESTVFSLLETEQQDLFLQSFKKVLSGKLDEKLFELKFDSNVKDSTQQSLYAGLRCDAEEWQNKMLEIVSKMFNEEVKYKDDTVITFIRADYRIPLEKKKKGEEDEEERLVQEPFIFCSVNTTAQPKKALLFDYTNREFKSNLVLDAMINLTSPRQGFMFPVIQQDATVDVNHVLYSTGKKNLPDLHFTRDVLNCESDVTTAESDSFFFNEIINKALDGSTNPAVISNVYHTLEKIVAGEEEAENDEPVMLDYRDIENILEASGVGKDKDIKHIFKEVVDDEYYELKAENLLSNKPMTIETNHAQVSVAAQDLEKVRQVMHNGKLCLMIEIDQNAKVNGLLIETEKVE